MKNFGQNPFPDTKIIPLKTALTFLRSARDEWNELKGRKTQVKPLEESRNAHDIHGILASGARELGNTPMKIREALLG